MNVKFSTKFVAASAAAVMALSLAGCSGGSMDDWVIGQNVCPAV